MKLLTYVSVVLLLYIQNGQCRRRHHHKKVVQEEQAADVPEIKAQSINAAPAPIDQAAATNTAPPGSPGNFVPPPSAQYAASPYYPNAQNPAPYPEGVAAVSATPARADTATAIKADVPDPEALEKSWKNHTAPFLRKFKDEIDNGKIKHHDYEELTWFMKFFAEEYPDITRLYTIGE